MDDRLSAPVSVVIPCFRCAQTVERAVFSIVQQTLLPEQVLLVEDCSGDAGETLNSLYRIQASYGDRLNVKIIRLEKNGGPGVARNAGWEAAKSSYIAFLDADDVWHPRKLEIQIAWMEAHPEVALTGTRTLVIERLEEAPVQLPPITVRKLAFSRMLVINSIPTRSVVVRSNVPNRFLPGKRYSEDYLLWLSAIADGYQAFLLEVPLAYSFKRDFGVGGLSAHLWKFHCEVLDTYKRLYQAGHINWVTHKFLGAYSFLKLMRRWFLRTLCLPDKIAHHLKPREQ